MCFIHSVCIFFHYIFCFFYFDFSQNYYRNWKYLNIIKCCQCCVESFIICLVYNMNYEIKSKHFSFDFISFVPSFVWNYFVYTLFCVAMSLFLSFHFMLFGKFSIEIVINGPFYYSFDCSVISRAIGTTNIFAFFFFVNFN